MTKNNDFYHQQLNNTVSDHIRQAILQGDLRPGEWIRQKRVADELGISQMPVREAFKKLAAEGLVEHIPYRGVRVVTFTRDDIIDLYAHRALLESRAARAAALVITEEVISTLQKLQNQMEQNLAPEKVQNYRNLNRDFHQTIYRSSQRQYLIRTLDQMWLAFPTMLFTHFSKTYTLPLPQKESADIQAHRAIISSLANRDADGAEELVFQHIESSGEAFTAFLNTAPERR